MKKQVFLNLVLVIKKKNNFSMCLPQDQQESQINSA